MMARKDRFPVGFSAGYSPNYGSEGSGSSGRVDTEITHSENSRAPKRKVFNLNFGRCDSIGVPTQVLPLSKMSPAERKNLLFRLKAELEQIRGFHRRVETQRMNSVAISSSSDVLSYSNIGKSSKQDSAPGRNVNPPASKARGGNRGSAGKLVPAGQPAPNTANAILMKQCEALLKKLMQHQYGWVFNTPVDVVKLNIPDYFTVIKHPMDLGTVKRKIESGEYSTPQDFAADVRLTFSNAMTYNPRGNDVHLMADDLSKFFEVRWKVIQRKLPKESQSVQEKSGVFEEKEVVKPTPPSKKRKITSMHLKPLQKPVVRKMTNEEKLKLSGELEELLGELPDNIVEFLKDQTLNGRETGVEEIEIDIDILSDETLFKLRKLLDDYILEKQKNQGKAEPCEIELLNDSGPSNSSMLLCKGNDPVDEDIDIGGNEPPVSSFPPVKIDPDTEHRSISNGHSDIDSSKAGKEPSGVKASSPPKPTKGNSGPEVNVDEDTSVVDLLDGNPEINSKSVSGLEQPETNSEKLNYLNLDSLPDGESAGNETQLSPERLYRAAVLKNRFADTILKAREKTLVQGEKGDPDTMRRAREELEAQKKKEKARLQAEARAAEDARRRAEAMVEAEAKRKRDLEREAARQALQMMEKTVEINENSRFLEDLEMLRAVPPEQLPSSADEASPEQSQDPLGSFNFRGSNALEQLGLFMKLDEEEEEGEPPSNIPHIIDDMEEGEVDEEVVQAPKIIPSVVDNLEEGEMGEAHKEGGNKFPSSVDDVEEGEVGEGHEEGDPAKNFSSIIDDVEEGKMGDDNKDCKPLDNISSMAADVETEEMDEDPKVGEQLDKIRSVTDVGIGEMDEDHDGGLLDNISKIVDDVVEWGVSENDKEGGETNNIPHIVDDVELGEMDKDHEEGVSNIVENVDGGEIGGDNKDGDTSNNIPNIVNVDGGEMHEDCEEDGLLNDVSTICDNVGEANTCMDNKEGDAPYCIPTIIDDVDVREMGEDHEESGSLNVSYRIIDNVEEGEMGKDDKEGEGRHAPSNIDDVDIGEMHTDHDKDDSLPSISRIIDNEKEGDICEEDKDGDARDNIPSIVADVDAVEMEEDLGGVLFNEISRTVDNVKTLGMDKDDKDTAEPDCIPSIVDDVDLEEAHKDHEDVLLNDDVHLEEAHKDHEDVLLNDDVFRIVDNFEEGETTQDDKEGEKPNIVPNMVDDVAVGKMDEDPEIVESRIDISNIVDNVEEWVIIGKDEKEGDAPNNMSMDEKVDDVYVGEISEDHVEGMLPTNISGVADNVEDLEMGKNKEGGVPCDDVPSIVYSIDVGEVQKDHEEDSISRIMDNVEDVKIGNFPSISDDVYVGEFPEDHGEGGLPNNISGVSDNVEEWEMGKNNKEGDVLCDDPSIVHNVDVGEVQDDHEEDSISRVIDNVEDVKMGNFPSISDDVYVGEFPEDHGEGGLPNVISRVADNVEELEMGKNNKEGDVPCNDVPSIVDSVDVGEVQKDHEEDSISRVIDNVEDVKMGNFPSISDDDVKGELGESGKGQPSPNTRSIVDDMEEDVVVD